MKPNKQYNNNLPVPKHLRLVKNELVYPGILPRRELGLWEQLLKDQIAHLRIPAVTRAVHHAALWFVCDNLAIPSHKVRHRLTFLDELDMDDQLAVALFQQVKWWATLLKVFSVDWL